MHSKTDNKKHYFNKTQNVVMAYCRPRLTMLTSETFLVAWLRTYFGLLTIMRGYMLQET